MEKSLQVGMLVSFMSKDKKGMPIQISGRIASLSGDGLTAYIVDKQPITRKGETKSWKTLRYSAPTDSLIVPKQ